MQSSKTYPQPHSNVHENTLLPSIQCSGSKNKSSLSSSTNKLFSSFPQRHSQGKKISFDETYFQAKQCITLIEDPLWKQVCTECIDMMGPAPVLKIWSSSLGSLTPETKTMDLSCPTKEAAQLIQQYDFVILGMLRRYFPTLNELRIEIKSN